MRTAALSNVPYSLYPRAIISLFNNCVDASYQIAVSEPGDVTYLRILRPLEPGLVRCLREPETRQTRCDNVETGVAFPRGCQERKNLLYLEEVTGP